jgi:hypothetical protein
MRHLEALFLTVSSAAGVAASDAVGGGAFVPLAGDQPAITTAVVTRHRTTHMPSLAFLRSVSPPSTGNRA